MSATISRTERGQKLRALNWVKQVRSDLTSAEFALQLEVSGLPTSERGSKRRERSIDYDSIAVRLENSLRLVQDMRTASQLGLDKAVPETELRDLEQRLQKTVTEVAAAMAAQDPEERRVSTKEVDIVYMYTCVSTE
eukprot:16199-Heterococcus_DN1.PRE.2